MSTLYYALIYCGTVVAIYSTIAFLICYVSYGLIKDLRFLYAKGPQCSRRISMEPATKKRVQPVPPPSFTDSLQIWHMAMNDRQPRRMYWLTEDHMEKLKKANPTIIQHGQNARKMFDYGNELTVNDPTIVTEELTKTMANDNRKKKRGNVTTRTAKTEEVEARWRRLK